MGVHSSNHCYKVSMQYFVRNHECKYQIFFIADVGTGPPTSTTLLPAKKAITVSFISPLLVCTLCVCAQVKNSPIFIHVLCTTQ